MSGKWLDWLKALPSELRLTASRTRGAGFL